MPKNYSSFLQSREVAGICCGLSLAALSPDWGRWLDEPWLGLLNMVWVAMLAGLVVAGSLVRAGHPVEMAVRRGTVAGAFALLVTGSLFLWGLRETSGPFPIRAWMIFGAAVLPAIIAASIVAGLGGMGLRRQVDPLPKLVELPRPFQWVLRCLIVIGFLSALAAPWLPRPAPEVEFTAPPPSKETRVSVPVARAAPQVKFTYKTPEELKTASPIAWKVKTTRRLGPMSRDRGVAFSKDQRFLAWGESANRIVVHDLETENVRRISGIPYAVQDMAFSPDGERLFVIMQGQPLHVGVGFLKNDRFVLLPQPKKYAVPDGQVFWWTDNEVVFLPKSEPTQVLNLTTLELDLRSPSTPEMNKIRSGLVFDFPANERWAFGKGSVVTFAERPEVEGTREWTWQSDPKVVLKDLERVSSRIFPEITPVSGDVYFGVRDGSKLMQIRGGELSVFYFESGPVPPLRWKIKMPHGPGRMKEKELVQSTLNRGALSFLMYAPMINPLNDRTVGPDREHPKAILRVLSWEGTDAEVWIESGSQSYSPGDVFADLYVPGDPPRLVSTEQVHPWWLVAPEPVTGASDPHQLPLQKDMAKEPTEEEKAKFAQAMKEQVAHTAPVEEELDDLKKAVTTFVFAHHAAASAGRLNDVVNDYANRVDHFKNGIVGRDFILKDEKEYHQKYRYVRETVQGALTIKPLEIGQVEVSYIIENEWQRLSDNVTGGGVFRIVLTLENQLTGWKIIRHKADKQN